MNEMKLYRVFYMDHGACRFTDIRARSCQEAEAAFWDKSPRTSAKIEMIQPLAYVDGLSADEAGDESSEERGEKPLEAVSKPFEPEVVAPGEYDERTGDGDLSLLADERDSETGLNLLHKRVEHDVVLLVGDSYQVKVRKLFKHRFLVDGPLLALPFKSPFEIATLARVLADLEQVHDEVGGDAIH